MRHIDALRQAVRLTRQNHPFDTVAMVVLSDHLHDVWTLPPGDADHPTRWALIKAALSRQLPKVEAIRDSRRSKHERGLWQRRYWKHQIRDDANLQVQIEYVHFNPVKHDHVRRAMDWPFSTVHRYIEREWLTADWIGDQDAADHFSE